MQIILNFVAVLFVSYMANGPFRADPIAPATPRILETAELKQYFPNSQFNSGLQTNVEECIQSFQLIFLLSSNSVFSRMTTVQTVSNSFFFLSFFSPKFATKIKFWADC